MWLIVTAPIVCMTLASLLVALAPRRAPHVVAPAPSITSNEGSRCAVNSDCSGRLLCIDGTCAAAMAANSSPQRDPRTDMCPHAARRLLDKMYGCGFNTDGMTESGLCEIMTYDRLILAGALNCRELSSAIH